MCVLNPDDVVDADALSELLPKAAAQQEEIEELTVGMSLQEMERQLIEQTLDHYDGHREKTAKALGIGVRTLANKLKSYGYQPRAKTSRAA